MKTRQTIKARKARKEKGARLPPKAVRCTIYALTDKDGFIRYVGQTRGCAKIRFNFHLKSAFTGSGSPVSKWVADGGCTGITILQENAVWLLSEALWIRAFRNEGARLLNASREHDHIYTALDHEYTISPTAEIHDAVING